MATQSLRKAVAPVKGPDEYLRQADTDNSGGISLEELGVLLKKILPHAFTQDAERFKVFVAHEMEAADLDMDGFLNKDEFYMYYYSKLCFDLPPNIELPGNKNSNPGEELFRIYAAYCSYGRSCWSDEMDSKTFMRLCKNAGLIDGATTMKTDSSKLSRQNLDLIFAKVRANRVTKREMGGNKIDFQQFLEVLTRMAQRKKVGVSTIIQAILDSGAPKAQLMEPMGFFEVLDPPTGGPTGTLGRRKAKDRAPVEVFKTSMPGRSWSRNIVSDFIDWSARDNSGTPCRVSLNKSGIWRGGATFRDGLSPPSPEGCSSPIATFRPPAPPPGPGTSRNRIEVIPWWTARNMTWEEILPELKDIFMAYNQSQAPPTLHEMSAKTFTQMCVDSGLVRKGKMKPGDAMDIFKTVQGGRSKPPRKIPGQRGKKTPAPSSTMNINQFIQCLREVANLRRLSMNEVCEMIMVAGAPMPDNYVPPPPDPPTPSETDGPSTSPSESEDPAPPDNGFKLPVGTGPTPSRYDGRYANGGVSDSLQMEDEAGGREVGKDEDDDDVGKESGSGIGGEPSFRTESSTPRRLDFSNSNEVSDEKGLAEGRPPSAKSSKRSGEGGGGSKGTSRAESNVGSSRGSATIDADDLKRPDRMMLAAEVDKDGDSEEVGQGMVRPPSSEGSMRSGSRRDTEDGWQDGVAPPSREVSTRSGNRGATEDGGQDSTRPPSREASIRAAGEGGQDPVMPEVSEGSKRSDSRRVTGEGSQKLLAQSLRNVSKEGSQEMHAPPSEDGAQDLTRPPSREASIRAAAEGEQDPVMPKVSEGSKRSDSRRVTEEGSQKLLAQSPRNVSKEGSQEMHVPPSEPVNRDGGQEVVAPPSGKEGEKGTQEYGAVALHQGSEQDSPEESEIDDSGVGASDMQLQEGSDNDGLTEVADAESIEAFGDIEVENGQSADGF